MSKHSADSHNLSLCIHCNVTFKSKKSLDEHTVRKHLDLVESLSVKVYKCAHCSYKTTLKTSLHRHMSQHPETEGGSNLIICGHCNITFKSKQTLDDHTIRTHPDFIASVSGKIHECTYCTYKTSVKSHFDRHIMKHSNTKLKCMHCKARYECRIRLDEHIFRKHPDSIASISSKIHECTYCTFKTLWKTLFDEHTLKRHGNVDGHNSNICVHCNTTYKSKKTLDDHTVRKHRQSTALISRKIYECTCCAFKTVMKSNLARHMLKHPEGVRFMCTDCNAKFTNKKNFDNHTLRKHPHLIATITRKLHKCTYCAYQTVLKANFDRHLLTHPETVNKYKFKICVHCNAKFKHKFSLDDHTLRTHPDFIASLSCKVYECPCCPYKSVAKAKLDRHMLIHNETANKFKICVHCNKKFKKKSGLDDHTLRNHIDFIASVSSEVHECPCCTYKTVTKAKFDRHMLIHTETANKFKICVHCNKKFKSKASADDHTIREHPDLIATISSKIHACRYCTYKTTKKNQWTQHLNKHAMMAQFMCTDCNAIFTNKKNLDDHTLRKHPHLIATITRKLHKCTYCAYQTVLKANFDRHLLTHPETVNNYKFKICVHCNAKFRKKGSLDDHTLRKHPDCMASFSCKVYKCAHCTYKTVTKATLGRHMLKHFMRTSSYNLSMCVHCNATYKSKRKLDEHVVRKHPNYIASISRKMHECIYCTYKSTMSSSFAKHMLKHPETMNEYKFKICVHCNAKFKHKFSLDDHTLRKHPDFIASLSCKVYDCPCCPYKTVAKAKLDRHMLIHNETASKFKICVHCNKKFKNKSGLDDHTLRNHMDFIASVSSEVHECPCCTYKTVTKAKFDRHMLIHTERANKFNICVHCNAKFKSKASVDDHTIREHPDLIATISSKIHECRYCTYKTTKKSHWTQHLNKHAKTYNAKFKRKASLDDHTLRKHPDFMASVSCKVYECAHCTYKTVMKATLVRHMTVNNYKFKICVHCNLKYKHKFSLDDHTLRKHPDLIATISSKIHECTYCTYKTTRKSHWIQHLNKHAKTKLRKSTSNVRYKSKQKLDNHIISKHPNSMASISSKIHECKLCTYKTTVKSNLTQHMTKHTETADIYKLRCKHCDETFKRRPCLDEHVIRIHPHLIPTVTSKIHECSYCAYQTVRKHHFVRHMLKHRSYNLSVCLHCNAKYKSKQLLDYHILRKHPNAIASVSSKIHECTHCTYKTTLKSNFSKHMLKHSEAVK
nr:unnamed protein product [Callosobruchus analis]